jgi:crotonobetaine/carnitine-CoA ligase
MGPWIDVQTFSSRWELAVQNYPLKTFLIFEASDGSVKEWTYGSFDQLVNRVAHHLDELGVRQGSSVHLALTNSPAFVAIWIAAIRLGAWIVPSDPFGMGPDLQQLQRVRHPVMAPPHRNLWSQRHGFGTAAPVGQYADKHHH